MPIDNTTYNFCIESLRYIHKMIGYKAIIEELNFIQHLHTPHRSKCIPEQSNNTQGIPEQSNNTQGIPEQSNNTQGIPEHIVTAMLGLDDMTEYSYDSEFEREFERELKEEQEQEQEQQSKNKDTNKNVIIETKQNKNKYSRTELPDEKRCEFNLPTGKRCTFKRADNSNNCSRHSKYNT
jgi:hypothetical protein